VFSVFGDLFESLMKRHACIKDSSALIPGHGGLLDRLDSIVSGLVVFALVKYGLAL
jgi:phosphatidate cytidylyltransferase